MFLGAICIEYKMYRLNMNIIDGPVIEKPTYPLRAQGTTKPKTSMLTCHFCRCLLPKNSGHKAQAWFLALIRTGDWSQTVQLSSKLKKKLIVQCVCCLPLFFSFHEVSDRRDPRDEVEFRGGDSTDGGGGGLS